ncbi:hypothetical protein [Paraburkholderia sp. UYCP14C]|uniref:hypothetical protein n=1 Tax=Paraburkholderia sp. UYCP14C TaxID=2511130 RepID=UPI001B7D5FE4|nr:hypothetical protein [Paraburkholderia sp. UYCP14C]
MNSHGRRFISTTGIQSNAAWAMINAMKAADSTDPQQFIKALRTNSFDGITGTIAFTQTGDLKDASATLYEEQNGKWAVLAVEKMVTR